MFIERICVATDGSDVAVRAAQIAVLLAHAGGRRIVALSVAQPHFSLAANAELLGPLQAELDRSLRAAQAHVETVARIAQAGGVACDTLVRVASMPGPEIMRAAQEHGCDFICMGAHGPNDANTLYTGSVAQHVLAWSSIPVLLLRDPGEAAPPEFGDAPAP